MRLLKKITSLFLFIMIISSMGSFAQTEEEVSDKELKQFATAFQEVQTINEQAQNNMVNAIEKEGLNVQRFNEIQQAQQDPNQEAGATDEELEQYESAITELEKIQMGAQQEMEEKITNEGLTIPRYQEIAAAIQASPELQQKFREYLQG